MLMPMLRLDVPNARSSHLAPTPRGGGLGILAGLAVGCAVARLIGIALPGAELLVAAAIVAAVGLWDDVWGPTPIKIRLAAQLLAAGLVVYASGGLERSPLPAPFDFHLGYLSVPAALFWIVAVTNVYNFLDGMDGFAALQGAVAGLALALVQPGGVLTAIGLAMAGACLGFLGHNWHPAKTFMGDVGSTTIGFVLAALHFQIDAAARGNTVFLVAICLWFFLADGAFTLIRRLVRGERPWQAHRSHLYQRLVRTGLRHDQVVVPVMAAAALLATLAVVATRLGAATAQWCVVVVAMIAFFAYSCWTMLRERHCAYGARSLDAESSST
jgi:UDP-N-acetylmuramyl pentapeptide phosphotransferase/UDP-N-acetylglucosamine-1-phosphate transferase